MDPSSSPPGGEVLGNLALCQTTNENTSTECLDVEPWGETIMQERLGEGSIGVLNWRFENGLLRAVNRDGYATDECLGLSQNVTTLNGDTVTPYELFLQNCPENAMIDAENIFAHDELENSIAPSTENEGPIDQALHMRFLIVGDGRIISLAPIRGENVQSFCVTAMKWGDVVYTNAVLAPCLENDETLDLAGVSIGQEQQDFNATVGSSFDPFLLHLPSNDKSGVELAYQIGYNGAISPETPETYDSYVIKVVTESDLSLLSETTVSEGVNATSGFLTLPEIDATGKMEAHLIGISRGGLESDWLASTSFELPSTVSEASGRKMTNGMTWALVFFLGVMTFYVCLVKLNGIFCPSKPMQRRRMVRKQMKAKRNSDTQRTERTVDITISQAPSQARDEVVSDWGGPSARSGRSSFRSSIDSQHSILFRISEEQFDMLDIEQASSDEAPTFAADIRSTDSCSTDSDDDMNSTAGVAEEAKDITSME